MAEMKKKDPAAVALGRKGGKKGGPARAASLTPEQRSESSSKAVKARWAKVNAEKDPAININNLGGTAEMQTFEESAAHAVLPPIPAIGDTSDDAARALMTRIGMTNSLSEIKRLTEQLHRVIFHKQFEKYGG